MNKKMFIEKLLIDFCHQGLPPKQMYFYFLNFFVWKEIKFLSKIISDFQDKKDSFWGEWRNAMWCCFRFLVELVCFSFNRSSFSILSFFSSSLSNDSMYVQTKDLDNVCYFNWKKMWSVETFGEWSLDRISLDIFSWSKFSSKLGVWSNSFLGSWSKF